MVSKGGVAYAAKVGGGSVSNLQDAVNLVEGGMAAFTNAGALIASNATSVAGDSLTFVQKRNGDLKISYAFFRPDFTKTETAYAAPAVKITAIGSNTDAGTTYNLNIPATLVEGQVAKVTLINKELPHEDSRRRVDYIEPVRSGDTAITLMGRLLARVNADAHRVATMSKVDTTNSDGYLFTGVTAGVDFSVECGGVLENADVLERNEVMFAGTAGVTKGYVSALTNLVNVSAGAGTSAQMVEAEKNASTREGNNVYPGWKKDLYTQPSSVVAGATYNQMIISSTRPNDNTLIPRKPLRKQLHIAVPASDNLWAILQNITTVFITPSA